MATHTTGPIVAIPINAVARQQLKNQADLIVDSTVRCASISLEIGANQSSRIGIQASTTYAKAQILSSLPSAAPILNPAIDTAVPIVTAKAQECVHEVVTQATGPAIQAAKAAAHTGIDATVDSVNSSFSS